jgi:Ca2+-binding EF-hand superfamily protein
MIAYFPDRNFEYGSLDNSAKLKRLEEKAARQNAEHEKIMLGKRIALVPEPKQLWKLLPERIVKNYEIVNEIGRGGYGCVILAKALRPVDSLPPQLAIKLCRPQQGEIPVMLKEGLAMQRISSPLIARCYDLGCDARDGGVVWFAMEHLQGRTLHELLIERGPMSSAEVCRVGIDLLDGLTSVHSAGLIHRDVKPQNIVRVSEPGSAYPWRYKLIDFGTATGALGPDRIALPALTARLQGGDEATEQGILAAAFASLDRDADGRLGTEDLVAAMRGMGLPEDRAHALAMVARYDSDRSGAVDRGEFDAMYGELAALPLSALALGPGGSAPPALRAAFAAVDADSDGALDLAELEACFGPAAGARRPGRGRLLELLARYDADGDGVVSAAEFAAMYGELAALQDAMTASGTHGSGPTRRSARPAHPA